MPRSGFQAGHRAGAHLRFQIGFSRDTGVPPVPAPRSPGIPPAPRSTGILPVLGGMGKASGPYPWDLNREQTAANSSPDRAHVQPQPTHAAATAIAILFALLFLTASARAYTPAAGYQKAGQSFPASAIAVAPDGKVAVGSDNFVSGGASIKVYSSLAAVGGSPLYTITDPTFKAIAGIEFSDSSTLYFGENADRDTAFKAILPGSPGAVTATALAPDGSVPNIADVTVKSGVVYATAANGLNASSQPFNKLYRFEANNTVTAVISNFGTGYIGGAVTDSAGNFLITDTGPFGSPGIVRRFDASFNPIDAINLAAGNGSGAVDLALDSEGDLFVSTGNTLTQVKFPGGVPTAGEFGTFNPDVFPFPTFLAFTGSHFEPFNGDGKLIVSGFTDEAGGAGAFVIQTPEPGTLCLAAGSMLVLLQRRWGRHSCLP